MRPSGADKTALVNLIRISGMGWFRAPRGEQVEQSDYPGPAGRRAWTRDENPEYYGQHHAVEILSLPMNVIASPSRDRAGLLKCSSGESMRQHIPVPHKQAVYLLSICRLRSSS